MMPNFANVMTDGLCLLMHSGRSFAIPYCNLMRIGCLETLDMMPRMLDGMMSMVSRSILGKCSRTHRGQHCAEAGDGQCLCHNRLH